MKTWMSDLLKQKLTGLRKKNDHCMLMSNYSSTQNLYYQKVHSVFGLEELEIKLLHCKKGIQANEKSLF